MNNFNRSGLQDFTFVETGSQIAIRPLMRLVYLWMFFGLLTTAIVSFVVASSTNLVYSIGSFILPIVIVQLGVVFGLSWGLRKMSPVLAGFLFFVYSALTGLTFGVLFFAYVALGEGTAIAAAFFTTAGLFGAMTIVGFTTNVDLTKYSTFFFMGLLGLIIAMVVNMFIASSALYFIVSIAGALLFTALTAYDTQRIKAMAALPEFNQYGSDTTRLAIFGALQLYLDFINLFLFLLRLFGGRRR